MLPADPTHEEVCELFDNALKKVPGYPVTKQQVDQAEDTVVSSLETNAGFNNTAFKGIKTMGREGQIEIVQIAEEVTIVKRKAFQLSEFKQRFEELATNIRKIIPSGAEIAFVTENGQPKPDGPDLKFWCMARGIVGEVPIAESP